MKDHGKGASECVNRELRGDVLSPAGTFSLPGLAFLGGICYNRKWFYGKSRINLNRFYPVAEISDSCVKPAGGIDLAAAGNSSTEYGYTKICTTKKKG